VRAVTHSPINMRYAQTASQTLILALYIVGHGVVSQRLGKYRVESSCDAGKLERNPGAIFTSSLANFCTFGSTLFMHQIQIDSACARPIDSL